MEQVSDFREWVLLLLREARSLLLLGAALALAGAGYGAFTAGRESGGEERFTATSAAAVNLADGGEIPYWTPSGVLATVEALAGSDFVYLNFAEALAAQGLSDVLPGEPSPADVRAVMRFYVRGNLLLADATTADRERSCLVSQCAAAYLAQTIPSLLNHVEVSPLDRQTMCVTVQPDSPSGLRRALKFGLLGAAGGAALGLLWHFFFAVFDLKIHSGRDLREFGLPVLGVLEKDPPEKGGARS